jgi:threonine dehydratase
MLNGRYDTVVAAFSDADIIRAMAVAADRLGLIVEPAGAAGLAAILAEPPPSPVDAWGPSSPAAASLYRI